jgi:hypothetical protein
MPDPHATPDRAAIEVSQEAADWITAKAAESSCTEDEVVAALIRSWDDECYA